MEEQEQPSIGPEPLLEAYSGHQWRTSGVKSLTFYTRSTSFFAYSLLGEVQPLPPCQTCGVNISTSSVTFQVFESLLGSPIHVQYHYAITGYVAPWLNIIHCTYWCSPPAFPLLLTLLPSIALVQCLGGSIIVSLYRKHIYEYIWATHNLLYCTDVQ